jgi:hypothetical protein
MQKSFPVISPRSTNAGKNARCICGKIIYAAFPLGDKYLMQFIQSSVRKAYKKTDPECLLRSFMPAAHKIPEEKHRKYEKFCAMRNLIPLPERYELWNLASG